MNLLNNILGGGNGNVIMQLAKQFGIDDNQMQNLLGQIAPALSNGFNNNAQSNGQLKANASSVFDLFQSDKPGPTIDQTPTMDQLSHPEIVPAGNSILSHIFGSKDVSRDVASKAAANTGIGANIVKQALPMIAILAASALYKNFNKPGYNQQSGSNNSAGFISQLLNGNQQQSIAGKLMSLLNSRR